MERSNVRTIRGAHALEQGHLAASGHNCECLDTGHATERSYVLEVLLLKEGM